MSESEIVFALEPVVEIVEVEEESDEHQHLIVDVEEAAAGDTAVVVEASVAALQHELDMYIVTVRTKATAHRNCSQYWGKSSVALHLPLIALNIISAVLSYFFQSTTPTATEVAYAVTGFTTVTAILAAVENYLELGSTATKHRFAARLYDALGVRLAKFKVVGTAPNRRFAKEKLEKRCNKALRLLEEILTHPDIPELSVAAESRATVQVRRQVRQLARRRPAAAAALPLPAGTARRDAAEAVVGILSSPAAAVHSGSPTEPAQRLPQSSSNSNVGADASLSQTAAP